MITGTKTILCGRRPDAMKFWMMWKARGHRGFQEIIDKAMSNARSVQGHFKVR